MDVIKGSSWGITGGEVWSNSMVMVASLAGFLLLGIVVVMVPKIIDLIGAAIFAYKYETEKGRWRDTSERNRAIIDRTIEVMKYGKY